MWAFFVLSGLMLICFGVLIVLMPELLAFMVAGIIIFAGISAIVFGLKVKHAEKNANVTIDTFEID